MRRYLPTFTSLLCFEASARHLSFTRAAEELNLTQSAVSRQVKNLEDFLKTALFERVKKRLYLTPEGQRYAAAISGHLNGLEAETLKLISHEQEDTRLNLGTFPTFGSRWLIPKLPNFTSRYPDIQYNLVTAVQPFDFDTSDLDVAIQHGEGHWPGVHAVPLMKEEVVAACAPSLLEGAGERDPAQVLDHTLMHLQTRPYAWREWLDAQGVTAPEQIIGPHFETFGFMIRAALSGLGIAIVPPMYIEEELRDGRLISPFGPAVQSQRGYYLVTPDKKRSLEKVQRFTDWLLSQVTAA